MPTLTVMDPVTRIEGHLKVEVSIDTVGNENQIVDARCTGTLFRGFETILEGREPTDAPILTQRICGVCPISHGIASVLAQDAAYGVTPPRNGILLRNLVQAANAMMSHIIHFYHLCILYFIDVTAITHYDGDDPQLNALKGWVQAQLASKRVYPAAPFLPRYEGTYVEDQSIMAAAEGSARVLQIRTQRRDRTMCARLPSVWGRPSGRYAAGFALN